MNKVYDILLDNIRIGTTRLESADVPMGVVFGKIAFLNIASGYKFFLNYCIKNKINFDDFPEEKLITTRIIPNLSVYETSGYEIKQNACSVSGMDSDSFEVYIEGIPTQFYRKEFPHHVKAYKDKFDKKK